MSVAETSREIFQGYEIATGPAKRQTILPGFFLDGATAELAVVQIDENGDRRVRIHQFDGHAWMPAVDAALSPETLFVDVANIGGRDRLIIYQHGRLNWFDPDSATTYALADIDANYEETGQDGIPNVRIVRDLNQDGRDDLALPDFDGFWIALQSSDGSFAPFAKIGPPEPFLDDTAFDDTRSYREVGLNAQTIPWYLSRIHQLDYDQDGRSDLMFWNKDHFDVHLQDEHGLFDPMARVFATPVPFDADGAYSLIFRFGGDSMFSLVTGFRKRSKRTMLYEFLDLNGNGVADLVKATFEGRSLLRQRGRYEVHFGTPATDGISFAAQASTSIESHGKQPLGYQWVQDFAGEGTGNIMVAEVRTGVGGMFRALLGKSIAVDLRFYRLEQGVYPDKPNAVRKLRPTLHPFGGAGVYFPAVLLGDVNGDGRSDLLVGKGRREMHVFLGVPGADMFARQPRKVAVSLPDNEADIRLADVNNDGKQDVLIQHSSATEPHRLTLLIAR